MKGARLRWGQGPHACRSSGTPPSSSALPSSAWAATGPVCGDAEAVGDTAAASTGAIANLTTLAGSTVIPVPPPSDCSPRSWPGSYSSYFWPGLGTGSSLLLKEPVLALARKRSDFLVVLKRILGLGSPAVSPSLVPERRRVLARSQGFVRSSHCIGAFRGGRALPAPHAARFRELAHCCVCERGPGACRAQPGRAGPSSRDWGMASGAATRQQACPNAACEAQATPMRTLKVRGSRPGARGVWPRWRCPGAGVPGSRPMPMAGLPASVGSSEVADDCPAVTREGFRRKRRVCWTHVSLWSQMSPGVAERHLPRFHPLFSETPLEGGKTQ